MYWCSVLVFYKSITKKRVKNCLLLYFSYNNQIFIIPTAFLLKSKFIVDILLIETKKEIGLLLFLEKNNPILKNMN
ncbi:hypothetical protein D2V05_07100 [Flagellimonas pelagia]|uniref:Uncharacterized protein n=1 Tax=Flagellimonas pelagia TaxID=2306998 RepID=A0A3A1NI97_9FLAO|nr:hypothetical protein D2V05_07100 [Allomuricauda maritima]